MTYADGMPDHGQIPSSTPPSDSAPTQRWFDRPWIRKLALVCLLVALAGQIMMVFFFRQSGQDFDWHIEQGRSLLTAGSDYEHIKNWYPPGRFAINALVAWLPAPGPRLVLFPLALAAWAGTFLIWRKLARQAGLADASRADDRRATLFTLGLTFPYVMRDMDDIGLQAMLLFVLSLGVYWLVQHKQWLAGLALGLATVLKTTPILFLPVLLWKRQWVAAVAMLLAVTLLNLATAPLIGFDATLNANQQWFNRIITSAQSDDLTDVGFEPPRQQNQSLRMMIARYTTSFGPQHPIHQQDSLIGHSLYFEFGPFSAHGAKLIHTRVMLIIAAGFAWLLWGGLHTPAQTKRLIIVGCAVLPFVALISPIAWLQHFVLILPALYLVIRAGIARGGAGPWRYLGLAFVGLVILILQRDVVGRDLSLIVLSYKFDTWAVLVSVILCLSLLGRETVEVSTTNPNNRADKKS